MVPYLVAIGGLEIEVVRLLIEKGVDVNANDNEKQTVLDFEAGRAVVRPLIENGGKAAVAVNDG